MSPTATSRKKCIFSFCDGSGRVYDRERNVVTICGCVSKSKDKKLYLSEIPPIFEGVTINSFETERYFDEESVKAAKLAKASAVNYIKNYQKFKSFGKGLYFYSGSKGSGKTRLASSIGNALIREHGCTVRFVNTISLLNEIKETYNADSKISESKLLEKVSTVEVLILDDLGVEVPKDWVNQIFYSILNERLNRKIVTIFTSNVMIEDLSHDERIKSRIEAMAIPIYLPDKSIRKVIAEEENRDLQLTLWGLEKTKI